MADENNLFTRKLQEFLSAEDVQKILDILEHLCLQCWDADKDCQCWNDD